MRIYLNVICEVSAIRAIGLVNISFVSLFGLEIQGPENATKADLFIFCPQGGGLDRPISQSAQGCQGVICHFLKRSTLLSYNQS